MSGALWRESPADEWREVDVIGRLSDGALLLRERNRFWPGLIKANPGDIRFPGGVLSCRAA